MVWGVHGRISSAVVIMAFGPDYCLHRYRNSCLRIPCGFVTRGSILPPHPWFVSYTLTLQRTMNNLCVEHTPSAHDQGALLAYVHPVRSAARLTTAPSLHCTGAIRRSGQCTRLSFIRFSPIQSRPALRMRAPSEGCCSTSPRSLAGESRLPV